jgi:hypothetical protein
MMHYPSSGLVMPVRRNCAESVKPLNGRDAEMERDAASEQGTDPPPARGSGDASPGVPQIVLDGQQHPAFALDPERAGVEDLALAI